MKAAIAPSLASKLRTIARILVDCLMEHGIDQQGRKRLLIAAAKNLQEAWFDDGGCLRPVTIHFDEEQRPFFDDRSSKRYLRDLDDGRGYAAGVFAEHPDVAVFLQQW